ncbi:MAG: hypothetical protein QM802_24680 [Agriterribacter sp.]
MKKLFVALAAAGVLYACNKSATDNSTTSVTASTTSATVGEQVAVTVSTRANTVSWSVTPPDGVSKTYDVTTEKTNYITFSKAGSYVVGVSARSLDLDSVHHCDHTDSIGHHVPDSLWNHHIDSLWVGHGFHKSKCHNGIDSASVEIVVN